MSANGSAAKLQKREQAEDNKHIIPSSSQFRSESVQGGEDTTNPSEQQSVPYHYQPAAPTFPNGTWEFTDNWGRSMRLTYKKGTVKFSGFNFSVNNPAHSVSVDSDGHPQLHIKVNVPQGSEVETVDSYLISRDNGEKIEDKVTETFASVKKAYPPRSWSGTYTLVLLFKD